MQSRMKKYYDNIDEMEEVVPSRSQRNKDLYKEVTNLEIEEFDLNSNASVIGDNPDNINLDDIKEILTEKYPENKKKKSFGDSDDINLPEIHLDETREYDITTVLEKAKEDKEINYEKDRLKKLRDTQYDIFNDIEKYHKDEDTDDDSKRKNSKSKQDSEELMELINTITAKELVKDTDSSDDLDPLDILTDLRGDNENTKVLGALVTEEEPEKKEDTLEVILKEIDVTQNDINTKEEKKEPKVYVDEDDEFFNANRDEESDDSEEAEEALAEKNIALAENYLSEEKEKEKEETGKVVYYDTNELGNVMSTKTLEITKDDPKELEKTLNDISKFTQSDFDDFNDLKEDMHATKIIVKILIALIIIVFIVGCVILLNKYLGLGLF